MLYVYFNTLAASSIFWRNEMRWKMSSVFVASSFVVGTAWATVVVPGTSSFANLMERPVADGVVTKGAARNTYFTDRPYLIPEDREMGVYYATWGVYGRQYMPHQLAAERFNKVYVAFGGICGDNPGAYENGSGLKSSCMNPSGGEKAADYFLPGLGPLKDGEVSFIDDSWGYFGQKYKKPDGTEYTMLQGMMDWKSRNPDLKIIWSLGGWSYSRPFYDMMASAGSRELFIKSVERWLSYPGMGMVDGVDIDFEFPGGEGLDTDKGSPQDAANYLALIKELRVALDGLSAKRGEPVLLTAAIGVGPSKLSNWKQSSRIADMLPYLDRLGLMTYDFGGAWNSELNFNAALAAPDGSEQVNIKTVIDTLKSDHGVTADQMRKISLGLAFYGRGVGGIQETDPANLPGTPISGKSAGGTVEDGVYSFFDLYENYIGKEGKGVNGWSVYSYPDYAGSIAFNPAKNEAITYTSPDDVTAMTKFAKDNGMMGIFAWQVDDDNGMLIEAAHQAYGHQRGSLPVGKPLVYAPDCQSMSIELSPGMVFSHEGEVFKSVGWATKCPGQGEAWERSKWQSIGSVSNFQVIGAAGGAQGGNVPVAITGITPTTTPAAAPPVAAPPVAAPTGDAWVRSKAYAKAGTIVTHKGATWKNKWWTQGGEPGSAGVWEKVAAAAPVAPAPVAPAPVAPAPVAPAPVAPAPVAPAPVAPAPVAASPTGEAWVAGKTYGKAGSNVVHDGKLWVNGWWTNGEPGVDSAWRDVTPAAEGQTPVWSQTETYPTAGNIVMHKGSAWKNKWWTQGGEPGSDPVWEKSE